MTNNGIFKKLIFTIAMILLLCFLLNSCASSSIEGEYKSLTSSRCYVFEKEKSNAGSFEIYENDKILGNSGKRYNNTWVIEKDVLILTRNEDKYYFKVFGDALISIKDKNSAPTMTDYIAPKGKTFDWEYGNYEFFKDGTVYEYSSYSGMSRSGDYYVENNIIYAKLDYSNSNIYGYEPKYVPLFYIYDGDHIIEASCVYFKK